MNWFSKNINYIIITVACLILAFVPPMIGSIAGVGLALPTTASGWVIWSILQACSTIANCLLFYAFTAQGEDNVKTHPSHLKAIELLRVNKIYNETVLISPQEWRRKGWGKKIAWMAAGTLLGGVALTQAMIAFDLIRFITQILLMTFGLIFGAVQMKKTEYIFSDYYLEYAEQQVRKKKEEEIAAQTTNYLEITTTSTVERTREVPISEDRALARGQAEIPIKEENSPL